MSESSASAPGPRQPEEAGSGSDGTPGGTPAPETSASQDPASGEAESGASGAGARRAEPRVAEQTLLEQMGGVAGLAYSAVPIVVFVLVSSLTSLMPAIWAAIGVAVAIAVVRVVRKEPLQPAISGVIGVAVCSFIAYRSGDAKGFFLLGIWTSLVYGGAFLVSILVRWPLVGVAWSALNGLGFSWRRNRQAVLGYDVATFAWTLVFGAKFVVQQWLYAADQTGWLAFARIAMGYPLTAVALVVTVWSIRHASRALEEASAAAEGAPQTESSTVRSNPSPG